MKSVVTHAQDYVLSVFQPILAIHAIIKQFSNNLLIHALQNVIMGLILIQHNLNA